MLGIALWLLIQHLTVAVLWCLSVIVCCGRCGFAQSQEAYDAAVNELFCTLDMLDDHLSRSRYLCGDRLTLADVCLFTTLVRFDLVYNVLFKCTKKKLVEYPNLHGYMRDIYQVLNSPNPCFDFQCETSHVLRVCADCCYRVISCYIVVRLEFEYLILNLYHRRKISR